MRKDKVSMKSILENARALRTASLSGRKNSKSPNPNTEVQNSNSRPISISHNSQSLQIEQQSIKAYQSYPYFQNHQSYQFSQPLPSVYNIRPPFGYNNESLQFQNMSQMSQHSQKYQPSLRNMHQHLNRPVEPRISACQQAMMVIRQLDVEMKKISQTLLEMKHIRNHVEQSFTNLRIKKDMGILQFIERVISS